MTTPVEEKNEPKFSTNSHHEQRSSDDDATAVGEGSVRHDSAGRDRANSRLTVNINEHAFGDHLEPRASIQSPSFSQTREQALRLDDDLAMLSVERQISQQNTEGTIGREQSQTRSVNRSRSRREEPVDEFDAATNPLHEKTTIYRPPENPSTGLAKFFKKVHGSSFLVRWITYITPVTLILLIPLLLGALVFRDATVGGVRLLWFSIWLEIVWLTLWAGRLLAKCLPWPIGLVSSVFTNNSKKWRDMGKQLEIPACLFFWWLAIEVSFLPTMINHHYDGNTTVRSWENTMNKVLVSGLVCFTLNFAEKIIIQLIAISFHLRTYQDRIDINKFQINSLTKLYQFSKEKIAMEDSEFEAPTEPGSGARTPGAVLKESQKVTRQAVMRFGDVAGKIAGDFTGKKVATSTHPHQIVLTLLGTTGGGQILARRLYRTFAREETETVHSDDLKNAFDNDDEANAAFSMFDKDMNGDISMEELEAVCVEIGRERKSITASLKDLDSVVSKLDDVFVFIVAVITILVFISLISTSAAGVLTSAGSTVLALSWLFSVTAQEFLQSIIFVFVKHPFDVGDRVTIYGNTGATMKGDDYFVKAISLLYTEFKKMEGHVVQAPNSYLNTLFILNQRRSGGLAEAVPVCIKYGTTLEQIDGLRTRLLDFVTSEKREYQQNILTELRDVTEAHSLTLNIVFFYKSNWQNELLRLQRRNKFICALMVSMQELGIEGPRMRYPGQKESFPVYLQNVPHQSVPGMGYGGHPDNPGGLPRENTQEGPQDPPFVAPPTEAELAAENQSSTGSQAPVNRTASILRSGSTRPRGESLAQMGRRVDFSLGMKDISSGDMPGDVFEDRQPRVPITVTSPSRHSIDRDTDRGSRDTARSTSVLSPNHRDFAPGMLRRNPTDGSLADRANHRNRFFSRRRNDLDEETGMADIPEAETPGNSRIDPRSGMVSPAAWRMNTNESNRPHEASGALGRQSSEFKPPPRSATDNFEMRRFH